MFGSELLPLEENKNILEEKLNEEIEFNKVAKKNSHSNRKLKFSKEEFEIIVWNLGIKGTSQHFSVKRDSVSNRCDQLGVQKPSQYDDVFKRKIKYKEMFGKDLQPFELDTLTKKA